MLFRAGGFLFQDDMWNFYWLAGPVSSNSCLRVTCLLGQSELGVDIEHPMFFYLLICRRSFSIMMGLYWISFRTVKFWALVCSQWGFIFSDVLKVQYVSLILGFFPQLKFATVSIVLLVFIRWG